MIWLTWRQLRVQAIPVAGAVALLLVALAITGPGIVDAAEDGARSFLTGLSADAFKVTLYYVGIAAAYVFPLVVGAFWGAPMVARELEARTHRLAWSQSVTRTRWLAVKLLGAALVTVSVAGLLSWGVTWWAGPIERAIATGEGTGPFMVSRIEPAVFGARGLVPIGYAVLALAIGVLAGLVVRRTVAAMAVTLVLVLGVQLFVGVVVRAQLVEPEKATSSITQENLVGLMVEGASGPGDPIENVSEIRVETGRTGTWELSNVTLDADGERMRSLPAWVADCGGPPPGESAQAGARAACFDRLADEGYRQQVTWHPSSAFWTLQWRETALLLVLALGLGGLCFWRIRGDAP
ncbi:ABC transporter permease [Mumia sp. zg.B53]|uniref:ABC transporter permease n=1 Tax=unclassified Mumia TaxID=2621872 RepID=UPI001C6EC80C|nr:MULTISPECIES: ABC transporter permease subunit [unclassified Mumia]MBW9215845.1 ABC transporter permease [Mumia sp. zg.B53]MDD9350268.1 ABC transporter permease subunit [Mumia sp.]